MADYSDLKRRAQEIKDEVKAGANSANRVGLALEETVKALEAENKRAEQAEESLENAVQMLQDETEGLQSIRDDVERLGSDKADKSALEATNKEVSKKQNKLDNYKEDPRNGSVEIFAQDKVSVRNDSKGGVSCVEAYNEEDTEGIIPVARMSADKENGDYASVTVKGNEVHIDGDAVKVNGEDLESFRTTVVNDLTTGGTDKALSAEMGKMLGMSVEELKECVHDLGDFGRSGQAEAEAGKAGIAGNPGIVLIHYTVGNENGIILQQVGETTTKQILFWGSTQFQRHINFSSSDKTSVSSTSSWWKMGATHTSYDAETRRLHLQDMNYINLNPSVDAVLPLASETQAGLMTMAQVKSLEGKQDQLVNYVEIPRGKTTIKYPNGTARVEVSNARAALWANDDKVAIAADAKGTRMLYTKTAEDGYIEHSDEISIGRHNDRSATHITLLSKSTTEDTGEKITNTSTIQVNPDGISMSSPEGAIGDVVKEIAAHQNDGIELLTNGNLKLTLKGITKEFMPATPSGDPMHWAYVSAGAEYNDSGVDIVKTGIFNKPILHKNGYWYYNEIGDLTNEDMRIIFRYAEFLEYYETGDKLSTIKIRTFVPSDRPYTIRGSSFRNMQYIETIKIASMYSYAQTTNGKIDYAFYNSMKNLRKIINVIYCYDKTVFGNTCFMLPKLEDIAIKKLPSSISFELCPNLSKESVKYMISNAAPTSAITITLHADAYARLAEDADIVAALAAKPLVTLVSA